MNFDLSVSFIRKHSRKKDHSFAASWKDCWIFLIIFRLPNYYWKQLEPQLIWTFLHLVRIKRKFKLRTDGWTHQRTLNSTFLQENLPNVNSTFVACTKHELGHIFIASDVDVLSKGWYGICVSIRAIFLWNCDWCLQFDIPKANCSIIVSRHE